METWLESLFAGLGWEILSGIIGFTVATVLGFLFGVPQFRKLRRDLEKVRAQLAGMETAKTQPPRNSGEKSDAPATTDYIGACAIVDRYIESALRDKPVGVRLSIRHGFINRFDKVTGAKLGEYLYNRDLLHQWIQSNAARFLVEHVNEML